MDSGREQNYWPGFVDALSNVVLTLVFVLVIFVFALSMAANKVEKKMQEIKQSDQAQKLSAAQQHTDEQKVSELQEKLTAVTAELEKMKEQNLQNSAVKGRGASDQTSVTSDNQEKQIAIQNNNDVKPLAAKTAIKKGVNMITLTYPLSVSEMDEKSATELGHVIEAMEKTSSKHKILLRSIIGPETYSVARRLAYYRALTARNMLIKDGKEPPSNITTVIVETPDPVNGRVEIVYK